MNRDTVRNSRFDDLSTAAMRPRAASLAETIEHRAGGRVRKAQLLTEAARQFTVIPRPSRADIAVFKEFFYQLIDGCDHAVRRRLSASLAANPYVPRAVAIYLALDEPDVAAPMLLFSPVLNEIDIVELARRLSLDHLLILCRRHDLTPNAVVSLIANGGRAAIKALAANSKTAQLPALKTAQAEMQTPSDGSQQEERTVMTQPNSRQSTEEQLLELAGRGGRLGRSPARPQPEPRSRQTQRSDLAARLIPAARAGNRAQIANEIALRCGCSFSMISNLLAERSLETLSVLMKGLEIDDLSASQLILLLRPETGKSREEMTKAVQLYKRLNGETCRQFVQSLSGLGRSQAGEAANRRPENSFAHAVSERRREIASPDRRRARSSLRGLPGKFGKAGVPG